MKKRISALPCSVPVIEGTAQGWGDGSADDVLAVQHRVWIPCREFCGLALPVIPALGRQTQVGPGAPG